MTRYAKNEGWEIYRVYSDDNKSGKFSDEDDKREGFRQMLEDAKMKKFDIVLCKTQSRFSRNASVVEKYVEGLFREWGIRFVTVVDNADNFDLRNKKARQINSLVNEWFLEDLSENIKEVYMYKMKKGEYLAPFAPYGYRKDEKVRNHLVVYEKEAETVRKIFDMYISGMSGEKIADELNLENIPSPSAAKGKGKKAWKGDSVYRMLHNKVYIGTVHQHREESYSYKSRRRRKVPEYEQIEVKNAHEAIVAEDIFKRAQERLGGKKARRNIGAELSKRLVCGECGKNMHTNLNVSGVRYYRCKNPECPMKKGVREDEALNWEKENGVFPPQKIAVSLNPWKNTFTFSLYG